jgi:hypothetical protein
MGVLSILLWAVFALEYSLCTAMPPSRMLELKLVPNVLILAFVDHGVVVF